MSENPNPSEMLELTTEIVAAHVGNNPVPLADLPKLIQDVYTTLTSIGTVPQAPERPPAPAPQPQPEQPAQQPQPAQQQPVQSAAITGGPTTLSSAQTDAVRRAIRRCWNFDPNVAGADSLVVEIRVIMRQDATVDQARVVDEGRYRSDPVFRGAADRAWRAVMNPNCQPLPLPPGEYETWRDIVFVFDPRDM